MRLPCIIIPPQGVLLPGSVPPPALLSAYLAPPGASGKWVYESRRTAQQILPWVWLGPLAATKDREFLAQRGITLLIAVRSSMTAEARLMAGGVRGRGNSVGGGGGGGATPTSGSTALRHPPPLGKIGAPAHVTLDLPAVSGAPLIPAFSAAAHLIDWNYLAPVMRLEGLADDSAAEEYHSLVLQHQEQYPQAMGGGESQAPLEGGEEGGRGGALPRPGATLVFCESGNEKSAAVAVSYVMQHFEANMVHAVQLVQGWRVSVSFDDNCKQALAAWESIYKSRRDVHNAQTVQASSSFPSSSSFSSSSFSSALFAHRGAGNTVRKRGFDTYHADDDDDDDDEKGGVVERCGVTPFRDKGGDFDEMDLFE